MCYDMGDVFGVLDFVIDFYQVGGYCDVVEGIEGVFLQYQIGYVGFIFQCDEVYFFGVVWMLVDQYQFGYVQLCFVWQCVQFFG